MGILVVTRIIEARRLVDKSRIDDLASLQRRHAAICKEIIAISSGELLHTGTTGIVCRFENPVIAVSTSIKILHAHKYWNSGTKPPEISITVNEGDFQYGEGIVTGQAYEKASNILTSSGTWELLIDEKIHKEWDQRGNRETGVHRSLNNTTVFWTVKWDGPSVQPRELVHIRSIGTTVGLLTAPLLAIIILVFTFSVKKTTETRKILYWGPITDLHTEKQFDPPDKVSKKYKIVRAWNTVIPQTPADKGDLQFTARVKKKNGHYHWFFEVTDVFTGKIISILSGSAPQTDDYRLEIKKTVVKFLLELPEPDPGEIRKLCAGPQEKTCYEDFFSGRREKP
ncbi:hypothetical protein KKF34_19210 [Myxococcota bacterium]|nr:hypothetical protein [Myxococcota bacterium]MBU1379282.1 hypothetical protein [Myxococcota bacterium]MBU1499018.1 hypothetical protein [Myxococcota bacterium]